MLELAENNIATLIIILFNLFETFIRDMEDIKKTNLNFQRLITIQKWKKNPTFLGINGD